MFNSTMPLDSFSPPESQSRSEVLEKKLAEAQKEKKRADKKSKKRKQKLKRIKKLLRRSEEANTHLLRQMEVGQVEAQRDCYQFLVKTLLELQGSYNTPSQAPMLSQGMED